MAPKKSADGWDIVSTSPVKDDGWNVVSSAPVNSQPVVAGAGAYGVPGFPAAPSPVVTSAPSTAASRFAGVSPLADAAKVVGAHAKNIVAAPYHAFADAPRDPMEQQVKGTNPDSGLAANTLGQFGLGVARMTGLPTAEAIKEAMAQYKAGNINGANYDADGLYKPSVTSSVLDAVPLAGPWSRSIETDAHQHGAVPALLGAATDIYAPKVAGRGISAGLGKIAPLAAETALRIRATDRGYGATPGKAIIENTSGVTPEKIAETGRKSIKATQAEQSSVLSGVPGMVDLTPARNVISQYGIRAEEENHPGTIKSLEKLGNQVATDYSTGQPIPASVRPLKAAALNRGISNAKTGWNPATTNDTMNAAAGQMHHELGESIAQVAPEIRPLNQRIQSLMPVVQRATAADLNAGVLQRTMGRFGAHTGALAGGLAGYHAFGVPGAVAGVLGPEIMASPEFQMGAARTAAAGSRVAEKAAPYITGSAAQLTHPAKKRGLYD